MLFIQTRHIKLLKVSDLHQLVENLIDITEILIFKMSVTALLIVIFLPSVNYIETFEEDEEEDHSFSDQNTGEQ